MGINRASGLGANGAQVGIDYSGCVKVEAVGAQRKDRGVSAWTKCINPKQ